MDQIFKTHMYTTSYHSINLRNKILIEIQNLKVWIFFKRWEIKITLKIEKNIIYLFEIVVLLYNFKLSKINNLKSY